MIILEILKISVSFQYILENDQKILEYILDISFQDNININGGGKRIYFKMYLNILEFRFQNESATLVRFEKEYIWFSNDTTHAANL